GCELGGALKNVIALSAGISDGLGYGDNTKAMLMTRGLHEIERLGSALGARANTFAGLTGIGDLIVTCTSMHSRNRRAGILIGQGVSPADAVEQVGTVEGYYCCRAAYGLGQRYEIEMPLTEALYQVLYEDKNVRDVVQGLMARPKKHEYEKLT
ncbi:MAG: glycerol-3-phosphate dehydrogenase, partial [Oscillospiraceae bacterium]|nr:glycerol-3-phosphate dehydrogenase [Oscillospiraceae bacterium]